MHVIVCIKMVPDTTLVKIDPETNTLIREGVPFITNPFDNHAIEEAVRMKDKYGAFVTVISMGPPSAETVLRRALSIGADRAVLISDRAFGGADTLATSYVLSEAIKKLSEERPVDLVFCGMQTIDGDTAQVGPGIACRLGHTQLTLVEEIINLDDKNKTIRVSRKLESHNEIVESKTPAMLTMVRSINRPRYPAVPARLNAEVAMIPVWSNEVLKLDKDQIGLRGSPTAVRKIFAPTRSKGEVIDGLGENRDNAIDLFIKKLHEWDVVTRD
ncbi:MAG: electron transfer flavoprotein subunit beta/FixA family protein [Candidatus Hinthialibacter antarcticus]|nr:electron transfer flavoprotein subunit beta/FixA family protein [Candidatus Hinthialibacter antarcticus]